MENEKKQEKLHKHHRGRRKKKTVGQIVSNIVLLLAIGVFLFSAFKLWGIFSEYNKGESEYDSLQDIAITHTKMDDGDTEEEEKFEVDFAKLKEINPDVVAWIRFDEPSQISYPVVKGADNEKYLKTTFEGKKNSAGTLFIDMQNAGDFSDKNTFIYGHNMKNGSMFGQLRKYKTKSFCEENPYFYIYMPDGKEITYQVFAVSVVKDISESYTKWYNSDEEFQDYIDYIRSISGYQTDVEVGADSQIVSLSTCTNVSDDERLLVHGVKISEKTVGAEPTGEEAGSETAVNEETANTESTEE